MSLRKFLINLNVLQHKNLKKILSRESYDNLLDTILDNIRYEMFDDYHDATYLPKIKTVEESIDAILKHHYSVARFGDGEFQLMQGKGIPMQKFDSVLQQRLIQVFKSNTKNFKVAIVRAMWFNKSNLTDLNRHFWRKMGPQFRKMMLPILDMKQTYLAAELSLAYTYFKNYDFDAYFKKIRQIWNKKDIIIVCGKSVFDKITDNIFDNAKSIEYVYTKSVDAFDEYDNILNQVKQQNKSKIVIIILGPTAKVLAYDLSQIGFWALDLGHIAKSYDWYKKDCHTNSMEQAINFFNPD